MRARTIALAAASLTTLVAAAVVAPRAALAFTVTSFGPERWQAADGELGFRVGAIVEDFEDTTLAPGIAYLVTGTTPVMGSGRAFVPALPATFDPAGDQFGSVFAPAAWDGTRVVIGTYDNQSHAYTDRASWGKLAFSFAGGAARVGFSIEQMQRASTLMVNGVAVGAIGTVAGTTSIALGSGRNGYLVVAAGLGERIYEVALDNGGNGDGWGLDHLLYEPAASPAVAATLFASNDLSGAVYRYTIARGIAPVPAGSIAAPSANGLAVRGSTGELFVSDFAGATISRFLSPAGTPRANGRITGLAGAMFVEELRFVDDELWVVSSDLAGSATPAPLLRVAFDAQGAASVAGTVADGMTAANRGMLWNPVTRELFVSQCCASSSVQRLRVAADHTVTALPAITSADLRNPHGMVMTAWGELVVTSDDLDALARFAFDAQGAPVPNGTITGNGLAHPVGLAIAPWGEIFAANQSTGTISRFTFDAARAAVANGMVGTPPGPMSATSRLDWLAITEAAGAACAPVGSPACGGGGDAGASDGGGGGAGGGTDGGVGDGATGGGGGGGGAGGSGGSKSGAGGCGCRAAGNAGGAFGWIAVAAIAAAAARGRRRRREKRSF